MKTVYGLYGDRAAAEQAIQALRAAGVSVQDVEVLSSEPLAFGRDARTWMPWLAALGGVVGGTLGLWFTRATQSLWPLQTGGMPIASMWTNGIITYEMTMLGAILATAVAFLASARLPARGRRLYDPAVSGGRILVGVTNLRGHSGEDLMRSLKLAGGDVRDGEI